MWRKIFDLLKINIKSLAYKIYKLQSSRFKFRHRNTPFQNNSSVCEEERCVTTLETAA